MRALIRHRAPTLLRGLGTAEIGRLELGIVGQSTRAVGAHDPARLEY